MSLITSLQTDQLDNTQQALAEIRGCAGDMQTFVAELFERLNHIDDRLLEALACQETHRQAEHAALKDQLERLMHLTKQLADSCQHAEW